MHPHFSEEGVVLVSCGDGGRLNVHAEQPIVGQIMAANPYGRFTFPVGVDQLVMHQARLKVAFGGFGPFFGDTVEVEFPGCLSA